MPRRARLSLPGIPWHIIQRGNNRSVCFHGEQDYQFYLHYLKEFADKFGCAVHSYVLMTNHFYLLLTPARVDSAGLLLKHLENNGVRSSNVASSNRLAGECDDSRPDHIVSYCLLYCLPLFVGSYIAIWRAFQRENARNAASILGLHPRGLLETSYRSP